MTVRINKEKLNLREKLTEFEDKVNFDEVVRGLGGYKGNVGIGTTNPEMVLSIKTDAAAFSISSEDHDHIVYAGRRSSSEPDSGYFRLRNQTQTTLALDSAGASYFNGGNVGIGTTNPVVKLQINDGESGIRLQEHSGDASIWFDSSDGDFQGGDYWGLKAVGTSRLSFSYGASPLFDIDSNGNVGIGTTSPAIQLDVVGGIQMSGDQFWYKGGAFRFVNRTTGASVESMRISDAGNVGIGTTNPSSKLEVHSGTNDSSLLLTSTDSIVDIKMSDSDTTDNGIRVSTKGNDLLLQRGGGNVGIGKQPGAYLLEAEKVSARAVLLCESKAMDTQVGWGAFVQQITSVASPARSMNSIIGAYRPSTSVNFTSVVRMATSATTPVNYFLWVDQGGKLRISSAPSNVGGTGGSAVGDQTSDERLKTIEPDFEYGLEQALQLKPIAYTLKGDEEKVRRLGFGAQTTQSVIPEAVYDTLECVDGYDQDPEDEDKQSPRSDKTHLGMTYVQLIPVLTKAIQEQQSIIEDLKSRIETLESK